MSASSFVGIPTSTGYIRGFTDNGGGVKPHYLTFYSTFGGINSPIGAEHSFQLELTSDDTEIYFIKNGKYSVRLAQIPSLNIQRLDEELNDFEHEIEQSEQRIKRYKREMEQCKLELEKTFANEEELKQLLKRQSELNNKLNLDNKKDEQILIEDEVTEENQEIELEEKIEKMEEFYDR